MPRLLSISWRNNKLAPSEGWFGRPVFHSLLELVIVVLIVTILIMIAIPNYRVANIKTIATEGLVISSEGRLQVHEYYAVTGKWLTQESALKNHQHSEIMTHNIEQGAVTMIFPQSKSLRLYGEQLTLRPVLFNNDRNMTFGWLCGYTQVSGLLPVGTNKTDIPAEHLMRLCRGDGDK